MKNIKIIMTVLALFISGISFAQMTEPGDGNGGVGAGAGTVGGGAPVGSGLVLLIALGAMYGTKKVYTGFKDEEVL